jgi:hypothetical protein
MLLSIAQISNCLLYIYTSIHAVITLNPEMHLTPNLSYPSHPSFSIFGDALRTKILITVTAGRHVIPDSGYHEAQGLARHLLLRPVPIFLRETLPRIR